MGFPDGSVVKNSSANAGDMQVQPLGQEDPLEEEMATTPVFLPRKSHGQRSLEGYGPWGHKELHTTSQLNTKSNQDIQEDM